MVRTLVHSNVTDRAVIANELQNYCVSENDGIPTRQFVVDHRVERRYCIVHSNGKWILHYKGIETLCWDNQQRGKEEEVESHDDGGEILRKLNFFCGRSLIVIVRWLVTVKN